MKIMATSFKRSHAGTAALSAPRHHWPTSLPETSGHSWASRGQNLMGSLLLSPGSWCAQGFVCVLQESVSPVLCKFWHLYGGVSGYFLQEGLCHTQVYCTQSPCCWSRPLLTHTSAGHSQTLFWLSLCGVSGSWCALALFEPSERLQQVWSLILNMISPLLPSFWGFSFALGHRVSYFGGIQHSPVEGCSAASYNFGVLAWEDERTSFSAILKFPWEALLRPRCLTNANIQWEWEACSIERLLHHPQVHVGGRPLEIVSCVYTNDWFFWKFFFF